MFILTFTQSRNPIKTLVKNRRKYNNKIIQLISFNIFIGKIYIIIF
jgi:hypothetical protein